MLCGLFLKALCLELWVSGVIEPLVIVQVQSRMALQSASVSLGKVTSRPWRAARSLSACLLWMSFQTTSGPQFARIVLNSCFCCSLKTGSGRGSGALGLGSVELPGESFGTAARRFGGAARGCGSGALLPVESAHSASQHQGPLATNGRLQGSASLREGSSISRRLRSASVVGTQACPKSLVVRYASLLRGLGSTYQSPENPSGKSWWNLSIRGMSSGTAGARMLGDSLPPRCKRRRHTKALSVGLAGAASWSKRSSAAARRGGGKKSSASSLPALRGTAKMPAPSLLICSAAYRQPSVPATWTKWIVLNDDS